MLFSIIRVNILPPRRYRYICREAPWSDSIKQSLDICGMIYANIASPLNVLASLLGLICSYVHMRNAYYMRHHEEEFI